MRLHRHDVLIGARGLEGAVRDRQPPFPVILSKSMNLTTLELLRRARLVAKLHNGRPATRQQQIEAIKALQDWISAFDQDASTAPREPMRARPAGFGQEAPAA